MNNFTKFHGNCPSGYKVKFNLASAIELLETAVLVYNFVQKPHRSELSTSLAHLTNFSFEFFEAMFAENASFFLLYRSAKKVKNDQKLKSTGFC